MIQGVKLMHYAYINRTWLFFKETRGRTLEDMDAVSNSHDFLVRQLKMIDILFFFEIVVWRPITRWREGSFDGHGRGHEIGGRPYKGGMRKKMLKQRSFRAISTYRLKIRSPEDYHRRVVVIMATGSLLVIPATIDNLTTGGGGTFSLCLQFAFEAFITMAVTK
jgi:hypothetical protein